MQFEYCPHCGTRAVLKPAGDDGMVPWCPVCGKHLWDTFTTCIICAVVNEQREVALLQQDYIAQTSLVCVSGIVKVGESAEEAACREIREELGLEVDRLTFVRSYPYPKKDMLMLGFRAQVHRGAFTLSTEVDAVRWVPFDRALEHIRTGSIAWQLVRTCISETP